MSVDLNRLVYPRHVHKGAESCLVSDASAAKEALAEGYSLLPDGAEYPVTYADGSAYEEPKAAKAAEKTKAVKGEK
jgi:hypothetical protein